MLYHTDFLAYYIQKAEIAFPDLATKACCRRPCCRENCRFQKCSGGMPDTCCCPARCGLRSVELRKCFSAVCGYLSVTSKGLSTSTLKTALPSLLMGAFELSKMSPEHTKIFQNHYVLIALLLFVILVMSTCTGNSLYEYLSQDLISYKKHEGSGQDSSRLANSLSCLCYSCPRKV